MADRRILKEERNKHTIKITLAEKSTANNSGVENIIYKNDNIFLSLYEHKNTDIKWAVNTKEDINNYLIHINNEDQKLANQHVVYSNNSSFFNKFKIFNMYDYVKLQAINNNKNSISLALYKDNLLKSLLLGHRHGILAVDGILQNTNSAENAVKLPPSYPNVYRDYTYKALFYLFPVDEI